MRLDHSRGPRVQAHFRNTFSVVMQIKAYLSNPPRRYCEAASFSFARHWPSLHTITRHDRQFGCVGKCAFWRHSGIGARTMRPKPFQVRPTRARTGVVNFGESLASSVEFVDASMKWSGTVNSHDWRANNSFAAGQSGLSGPTSLSKTPASLATTEM